MSRVTSTTVLSSTEAVIRQASAGDRDALESMGARCARRTLQRRFLGGVAAIPPSYLDRVCSPEPGDLHLVALVASLRIVALGSLSDGQLALLVEDEWQHAGIGSALTGRLLEHARSASIERVFAEVGSGNESVLAMLRRLQPSRIVAQRYSYRVELDPQHLRRAA